METIYCIGDSHVSVFLGYDQLTSIWPNNLKSLFSFFQVIRLGPLTAYNINNVESGSGGKNKFNEFLSKGIPEKSFIVFSIGEVDCRVHMIKQSIIQTKSYEEVVRLVVNKYMDFLKEYYLNYKFIVLLPPPTGYSNHIDLEYPRYGTEIERNKITKIFNLKLKEECHKLGIPTIGVFDFAVSSKNKTIKSYLWDGVHLSSKALPSLIKQLREITNYKLPIPIKWKIREILRMLKNRL